MNGCTIESEGIKRRYDRAREFEQASLTNKMVLNASLYPKWIGKSDRFIYELETEGGKVYRVVDALVASENAAFNHQQLAEALSKVTGQYADEKNLPIAQVNIDPESACVDFDAFGKRWRFHPRDNICKELAVNPAHWVISPDGKKAVFIRKYNIWIQDLRNNEEYALTSDGECHYSYGLIPERADLVSGFAKPLPYPLTPQGIWSPDSKKFFTFQTDERRVLPLPINNYIPQGESIRPQSWQPRYALPGDQHIVEYRMLVLDIENRQSINVGYPKVLDTGVIPGPFMRNRAWWSSDSKIAYFVDMSRYEKQARVVALDTQINITNILFKESSETFIDLNLMNEEPCTFFPLPESKELIWFSERTGWAHLYLYDLTTGKLKHPITEGQWLVREVVGFDINRRELYFQAAGRVADRDPYYREVCRVNIDTGKIHILASSDHDYIIHKPGTLTPFFAGVFGRDTTGVSGLAPSGKFFVTTRSRVDQVSVSELRNREGKVVMELAVTDIANLPVAWQWPEPVKLLAADNKTDIYGVVFRPTDFDSDKQYPVIDYALGLSIVTFVPKNSFFTSVINAAGYLSAAAWAELGFVVVIIDGRGTPYRNKIFHDESYGQLHTASNLEDHIAGIKQLAERYPFMDLDRVGITGPGGCNVPVYGLLAYPDFYKVGVACSVYDIRLASGFESYCGLPEKSWDEQFLPENMACNLEGKLLVIHGVLDNFFQVAGFFRWVDGLIRENKDIDVLLLPRGGHMFCEGYSLRLAWDYMVRHLQGTNPPIDFMLDSATEFALKRAQPSLQVKSI